MILKELSDYYRRLEEDPKSGVASANFSPQKISYAVVIDRNGFLLQVQDIRNMEGKKPRPIELLVPEPEIRTVGIASNFLWDNTGYVLGADGKGNPERSQKTFEEFSRLHHEIGKAVADPGMDAVLKFLDKWDPSQALSLPNWEEIAGANVVFRLEGENVFVHEHPELKKAWCAHKSNKSSGVLMTCLIQGQRAPIASLHQKIKGVKDAQSMGAAIVSFNLESFRSYGKEKNFNAPISEEAAFAYTTALNHLLRFESRQKLQIGDATTAFWTERSCPVEDFMGNILDPREDSTVAEADRKRVDDYLRAVRQGHKPDSIEDEGMRFFILGLAPNASRLAVRFWYTETLKDVNEHLGRHFSDLQLIREFDNQPEFPGIWRLLIETVRRYRPGEKSIDGDMNPLLSGAFLRSLLAGRPYPNALLSALIGRIRSDGTVNYFRASLIKAILKRNYNNQEVTVALNEDSTNIAYRLGRLFSVLEKAQEEAIPEANATIKDRFFGSASATPSIVFPQLLRLAQHHLAKLEGGAKVYKEQLIQGILEGLDDKAGFPRHLSLEEQGLFALGYYHQRKTFFTKKEARQTNEPAS